MTTTVAIAEFAEDGEGHAVVIYCNGRRWVHVSGVDEDRAIGIAKSSNNHFQIREGYAQWEREHQSKPSGDAPASSPPK